MFQKKKNDGIVTLTVLRRDLVKQGRVDDEVVTESEGEVASRTPPPMR